MTLQSALDNLVATQNLSYAVPEFQKVRDSSGLPVTGMYLFYIN